MPPSNKPIPLVVDLDGTLIKTDIMYELLIAAVRHHPLKVWQLPLWLLEGKARFKRKLAQLSEMDAASLPYRADMLSHLKEEQLSGRPIILATATDMIAAKKIADHIGIFSEVLASDGKTNLSGRNKAAALVNKFGRRGFDYIGDHKRDLPVWQTSRYSLLANSRPRSRKALQRSVEFHKIISDPDTFLKDIFMLIRPHQWIKNILVIAPLVLAHDFADNALWVNAALAFISFSALASSLYIANDLFDLTADRLHKTKRNRALAAGRISLPEGIFLSAFLLTLGFGLSLLLPQNFTAILILYAVLVTLYSWHLKRVPIIDVVILASFYVIRLLAGSQATDTPVSFWLLAFSLFFCLSLALVKRTAELVNLRSSSLPPHKKDTEACPAEPGRSGEVVAPGRNYSTSDIQSLTVSGITSGYVSVLVLALYINSPHTATLYSQPLWLWLSVPALLYWFTRTWLLVQRGQVNEDPIIAASKDIPSYITGAFILLSALLAL